MAWPPKQDKAGAFSDEDVCVISKSDPCIVWTGTKVLYSGAYSGTPLAASGYNFLSGESDVEPVSVSGWGRIRVPELNQLHKIFVFPHDPTILARAAYTNLVQSAGASGYPTGAGGCSGKMAFIHYQYICSGCNFLHSGDWTNLFISGLVDIVAFGSEY